MSAALSVLCVADESAWLDAIQADAEPALPVISWPAFFQAPMTHADPSVLAIARIAEQSNELDQRLGCLCRSFPSGVVVDVAESVLATDEQFFAHGFRQLRQNSKHFGYAALRDGLLPVGPRCYGYRLQDYKAVPDWLNARYWAHPERFHL